MRYREKQKAGSPKTSCSLHDVHHAGYVCESFLAYMLKVGAGEENRTLVISLEG